jgi:hypothetical protein
MPFTYSFERGPSTFVLLRARGDVDLVMWSNAMRQVIADPAFQGTVPVVMDVTEAVGAIAKPDELVTLARVWRLLTPGSVGAIIATHGANLDVAQEVERLSQEQLRAFPDLRTAVEWVLGSGAGAQTSG